MTDTYELDDANAIHHAFNEIICIRNGFVLTVARWNSGRKKSWCIVSPDTTVKTQSPSLMNMAERSSMSAMEAAIRLMMPKGAVLGRQVGENSKVPN